MDNNSSVPPYHRQMASYQNYEPITLGSPSPGGSPQVISPYEQQFPPNPRARHFRELSSPASSITIENPPGYKCTGHIVEECRRLLAELYGTFMIVTVGSGLLIVKSLTHEINSLGASIAEGLLFSALIFSLGQISGAHFNPATTFAFALRGVFEWWRLPLYWLAQYGGAFLSVTMLYFFFGNVANVGSPLPKEVSTLQSFAIETVLSFFLTTIILSVSERHLVVGPNAALAVGAARAALKLVGTPLNDAPVNPARSLAPLAISGNMDIAWPYLVGPLLGALIAVLFELLFLPARVSEKQAQAMKENATGKGHVDESD